MGGFPFLAEDDMKCKVLHESAGRLRVHIVQPRMTLRQADLLEYYMKKVDGVVDVKVYDRTGDAGISYLSLIHISAGHALYRTGQHQRFHCRLRHCRLHPL